MATITAELTTVSLADTITGWSGNSGQLDTEVYKQAATIGTDGAYTWAVRKNTADLVTFTPATNLNMTANYTNPHLYWTMRCDVFPFCEDLNTGTTNSGLMLRVTDGSGNYKQWHVAGADTWDGGWRTFVVDLTAAATHTSSGTLSLADVDIITWYVDNSNSGNIRIIDNTWMDAVRYGDGLQAESTTTEALDFQDIADDDGLTANYYGVLQAVDGVLFCQGGLVLGDSAGSANCNFVSSGETVYFRDQLVGSSHYLIQAVEGTGQTDIDISGLVCRTVGTTGAELDFDDTGLTSFTVENSTFIDMGAMTFYVGSITDTRFSGCGTTHLGVSTFTATGCTWDLCGQITQAGATLSACTISNSTAASAVLCDDPADLTGSTFISDGTGHALELTSACAGNTYGLTGHDYQGYAGSDGSTGNEVIYNNSGGAVTLNISGGDTPTIRNGTSATTTVNATVTFTLTNVVSGTTVYVEALSGGSLSAGTVMITAQIINTDPFTTNLTANQPFRCLLANASGATKYEPILFDDNTGSGFSRRIEQQEDA